MRKFILLLFILFPILCTSLANNLQITESNNINLVINSEKIYFNSPILLSNSHILFPLRELCDKLKVPDLSISWNNKEQSITMKYKGKNLILKINSNIAKINEIETLLPCGPTLYKNKTYIPIRMISEFLDYFVIWNENSKTAFIKSSQNYFETKTFLNNLNNILSNIYDVKIDVINEINDMSFGNSIYIDTKKNVILEKNILNDAWHNSQIKLATKTTIEEVNYISTLACGISIDNSLSNENYYVYAGFFPSASGNLSKGKLYIDTNNLYITKLITETETDLGILKQHVLFSYGENLI